MKRIVLWFLSTLTVVVLLFGYHTSTSGPSATNTVVQRPVTGSTATTPSPSATSNSTKSSSTTSATKIFTGPSTGTQWGRVQVAITVANGKITAVSVPVYPSGNGRDDQINSYALPILIKETINAQSAGIDMVSGATVSSQGYLTSLQGALDQAKL